MSGIKSSLVSQSLTCDTRLDLRYKSSVMPCVLASEKLPGSILGHIGGPIQLILCRTRAVMNYLAFIPTFAVRENLGGTLGAPLKPLRDDSALSIYPAPFSAIFARFLFALYGTTVHSLFQRFFFVSTCFSLSILFVFPLKNTLQKTPCGTEMFLEQISGLL